VVFAVVLAMLFIGVILLALMFFCLKLPKARVVPDDYPTIQDAVNAVSAGDIVFVRAGIYYEHVVIDKPISLVGENRKTTIVDGNGTAIIIDITAQNVSISNFTVRNAGFQRPMMGALLLNKTTNSETQNVAIKDSDPSGLVMFNSTKNKVSKCEFSNDNWALFIINSTDNKVSAC
jgi:nitrous oxidase accessory protein NosD